MESNRAFRANITKAVDAGKSNSREVGWGRIWECSDELTALRIGASKCAVRCVELIEESVNPLAQTKANNTAA